MGRSGLRKGGSSSAPLHRTLSAGTRWHYSHTWEGPACYQTHRDDKETGKVLAEHMEGDAGIVKN